MAPYLAGPMLVIPWTVDDRYRWWDERIQDRLTVHQILVELGADDDLHRRYCRKGIDACKPED